MKINKWLNKKTTNAESLVRILFVLAIVLGIGCVIVYPFKTYSYLTFDNTWGESNNCYKHKDRLVCEKRIEVQQYSLK